MFSRLKRQTIPSGYAIQDLRVTPVADHAESYDHCQERQGRDGKDSKEQWGKKQEWWMGQ